MDDNDARWYASGFNKPSDTETPEVPENLIAVASPHTLILNWDDARQAHGYRVRIRNTSSNTEIINQLTQDSELKLTGLQPASLAVAITARNHAGESLPTPAVFTVVP